MRWVAAFLGLFPLSLSAATIPPSESSLRAVLNTESFIFFSSSGTITLSAPLEINSNVTIDGAGQKIVIDGANGATLFKVNCADTSYTSSRWSRAWRSPVVSTRHGISSLQTIFASGTAPARMSLRPKLRFRSTPTPLAGRSSSRLCGVKRLTPLLRI